MPLRETTFIERNLVTWRALEQELDRPRPDPDTLRDLYAAVSDDLSYARTHYPNRSVRTYLNAQAAALSLSLTRSPRAEPGAFTRFWMTTVPLELYTQRYALLTALATFLLAFAIGWGSGAVDPTFAELVLGHGYVAMTEANIADGNVLGVYKDGSMVGGALGIAGNNLYVAMLTFAGGALFGLGTLLVILRNGIMVGVFQHFFFARGVGWESALGIWTHGTVEISCIVVAGGAGFALARGLLWPGTLTRSRAFQLSALSALRIMAGIAPLIVLAALIEGFITRLDTLPVALRVGFVLANAALVVGYFVVLPLRVGRRVRRAPADFGTLPPDRPLTFPAEVERPAGEIFFDALRYLTKHPGRYLAAAAVTGLAAGALWLAAHALGPLGAYYADANVVGPDIAALLANLGPAGVLWVLGVLTAALPLVTWWTHRQLPQPPPQRPRLTADLYLALAVPWALALASAYVSAILLVALLPFFTLWLRGVTYHRGQVARAFNESLTFEFSDFPAVLRLWAMLLTFTWVIGTLASTGFVDFALGFILLNLPPAVTTRIDVGVALTVAFEFGTLALLAALWTFAFGQLYHTLREHATAEGLARRLHTLLGS